jgi:hypothetical protein
MVPSVTSNAISFVTFFSSPGFGRGELSYLAPLGSKKNPFPISSSVSFVGEGVSPQAESNTTPPSPKTEITNILFYILNFASIITFKM